MGKVLVVARREYLAAVATRSFLIGLALMPVLMGGGAVLPRLLTARPDLETKKIVVFDASVTSRQSEANEIDGNNQLEPLGRILQQMAEHRNQREIVDESGRPTGPRYEIDLRLVEHLTDALRLEQSDRIRSKEIFCFVELDTRLFDLSQPSASPTTDRTGTGAAFYADGGALSDVRRWFDRAISDAVRERRLQAAGLNPEVVQQANRPVAVEGFGLVERDRDGGIRKAETVDRLSAIFLPMGLMLAMFALLWMTAQPSLESILEEKQLRISEVLLGSIQPIQWMTGKLLGSVLCSLTTLAIYAGAALVVAWYLDYWEKIPWKIVPWFVVYQLLGVTLYSSLFMAVGAAANSTKDAQSLMMPLLIFLLLPLFVWFNVIRDPDSGLAVGLSFYPPATPLLMIVRMMVSSSIPVWQSIGTMLAMLLGTGVCVFAAARIFRIGILSQGHTPSLRELGRWIVSG